MIEEKEIIVELAKLTSDLCFPGTKYLFGVPVFLSPSGNVKEAIGLFFDFEEPLAHISFANYLTTVFEPLIEAGEKELIHRYRVLYTYLIDILINDSVFKLDMNNFVCIAGYITNNKILILHPSKPD